MNSEKERDIVERLNKHALPDPYDEREVLHAPLLKEAAREIARLRAALSTEAQPEVTGAVAHISAIDLKELAKARAENQGLTYRNVFANPFRTGNGDSVPLYPASATLAVEARIRELEADAKRYRWLRDKSDYGDDFYLSIPFESPRDTFKPHEVDEAIDRTIEHKENES